MAFGSAEAVGYPSEVLERAPVAAALFTGVRTPVGSAGLQPGEMGLDLGCGAGLDSIWVSAAVGPGGRVVAADMAEPIVRARHSNAAQAGARSVLPVAACAEVQPLPDAAVDLVLVNCSFNLSPDKAAVIGEIRQVLRTTGCLAFAEVTLTRALEPSGVQGLDDWFR